MYYFRFPIPRNKDGTIAQYSPGWHGTLDKCPAGVVVDVYNDAEGYGIAHTPYTFVPPGVAVVDKTAISAVKAGTGVYIGPVAISKKFADLVKAVDVGK